MSSGSPVLITGVSGFLGTHVAHLLLESGHRVRGTARSSKVTSLQQRYHKYGDRFEAVGIDDLIDGDFTAALTGVESVVHLAAPLAGREATAEQAIDVAVKGSLNVLRQAEGAGVTNFVYMSSITAMTDLRSRIPEGGVLDDQKWNPFTKEDALGPKSHEYMIYAVEKSLAEQAVWGFADQHPHLKVTALNPPFFFGPFAPEYSNPEASISALSTNSMMYQLIQPHGALPRTPAWVDVRDVANAVASSLRLPPATPIDGKRNRFVFGGEWYKPAEVVEYLAQQRPELKDRLSVEWKNAHVVPESIIDNSRAKEALGIEVTHWKTTLLDAVDSLIELEKEWKSKGLMAH